MHTLSPLVSVTQSPALVMGFGIRYMLAFALDSSLMSRSYLLQLLYLFYSITYFDFSYHTGHAGPSRLSKSSSSPWKNGFLCKKRRFRSWVALLLLSFCGLLFQTVLVWVPKFQLQALYLALTWATTLLLSIVLRPRTSPVSLLLIYVLVVISISIQLAHSLNEFDLQSIFAVIQLIIAVGASIIVLQMPLRHPDLPNDDISATFTPPGFDLRSPEDNLTLFQFLSVSWMAPLIVRGKSRQLHEEDVWKLAYEFQHKYLHENFREVEGSVAWRLIKANCLDLIILTILSIIDLLAILSVPLLLQQLLQSMENPLAPNSATVSYAALSLGARLISAQIGVLSLWYSRRCYERSRGEMITMLYEKMLSRKVVGSPPQLDAASGTENDADTIKKRETGKSTTLLGRIVALFKASGSDGPADAENNESASMGKVLNIMRNDAYEIAQRFWECQSLVKGPLGLILAIGLLWRLIGWPCLVGISVVIFGQCINAIFARALLRWEKLRRLATDKKLQKVSQFIQYIRHLRWYGWQTTWSADIMEARERELHLRIITGLWNILISFTNTLASAMFPVAAFYAYTALAGQSLRIDIAFPALQVFSLVEENLQEIPNLITVLLNAKVAIGRIEDFMHEPDKDEKGYGNSLHNGSTSLEDDIPHTFSPKYKSNGVSTPKLDSSAPNGSDIEAIVMKSVSFAWPGHTKPVLQDISLSFSVGLNVVCGEVGAGKSALLQGILGELDQLTGIYDRPREPIGFCAQTPWLQSMSIRDNILFLAPYDPERYQRVLQACALDVDMADFKHGDRSIIGENGVGLSGGQRARVALARAIYSTAKILLLDDPISALDQQTAEFVVHRCLTGDLTKDRIVVLVTHRQEICKGVAKQIIQISHGRMRYLDDRGDYLEDDDVATVEDGDTEIEENNKAGTNPDKFIEDERRAHGGVKSRVYWEYIRAGKLRWWFCLVAFLILYRLVSVCQSLFMKAWGEAYEDRPRLGLFQRFPNPSVDVLPWLGVFSFIMVLKSVMFLISQCFMLLIVYVTGHWMFKEVLKRVTHATFRFYDITPIGRLLNRITSDLSTTDGNISTLFQNVATLLIGWVTSLVVIASVTPIFLAFSALLTVTFVYIFLQFLPTSQSLRRLEMVSLSPLMSNFGALVEGLVTIRAFCAQSQFQASNLVAVDEFQRMDHFYWSLQAWLMYRYDTISAVSTMIVTLIAVYTGVSAGLTAFVLIAAANFVMTTHSLCRSYGQLEMDFVSVERVVELLHLDQEPAGTIRPPAWWPSLNGDIVFDDVTIRYAPHLGPSLKSLSLRIKAGSSTAIIGRTGSGKSTLAMALLATVLPSQGRILINDIDIAKVNKQALRERITFVAQDPVLFPGSMRQNLDPMDEYSDDECREVLARICGRHGWHLETQIEAGGKNLSQGQRQLIGLTRTLLRRSPIIILDEATASIDQETAKSIQDILHQEMKGRTVITIAHRLEAVKNADYCIVLGKGKLISEGSAAEILSRGAGSFMEELDETA